MKAVELLVATMVVKYHVFDSLHILFQVSVSLQGKINGALRNHKYQFPLVYLQRVKKSLQPQRAFLLHMKEFIHSLTNRSI